MHKNALELIENFMDLFRSNQDSFAIGYKKPDGKYGYPPARDAQGKDLPLTPEEVYKHLKGEQIIGVWPLFDTNKACWIALDFDESDVGESPLDLAYEQKSVFTKDGIVSFVERSRSGTGAHLWIFVDKPLEARVLRKLVYDRLIDTEDAFDRTFPNQDAAVGNRYGNLIALPYHGTSYKENKSGFLDDERNLLTPKEFLSKVVKNKSDIIANKVGPIADASAPKEYSKRRNTRALSGGMKVVHFCKWMKAAQERMHLQNQEPEFYALCCQFAQLEDGERLAFKYGKMHPYSDERIKSKFEQAKQVNMPHTCAVLREEFKFECTCDIDYGVNHCYELAGLSFEQLMAARKGKAYSWDEVSDEVLEHAKGLYKTGGSYGYAYGYDRLDDLTSLRANDLIVIGARTGLGKTSIAVDITYNLTSHGVPVYWASMEMSKEQLGMKYMARQCLVDALDIMRGTLEYEDWRKLLKAKRDIKDVPLYIDDQTKDTGRIMDVMADLVDQNGKGVIFVDYIEMIRKLPNESMFSLTSRAALELKGMAKLLECPVVALSNFNRKAEQDLLEDEAPQDSWLRNSGLLEQTADVIMYVLGNKGKGVLKREVHIQKERFTGMANEKVFLWFEQAYSKFTTFSPKQAKQDMKIRKELQLDSDLKFVE